MKIFKFLGRAGKGILKGIGKGVRDVLPVPQLKDSIQDVKVKRSLEVLRQLKGKSGNQVSDTVGTVLDILDDGKVNQSHDEVKAETISRMLVGSLPLVAYVIYGIITGDWNFIF